MIRFTLNGAAVQSSSPPLTRLIDVIREELGDISVKEGCGEGECGACSVTVDGKQVNSCLVPVIQAEGKEVQTAAGLAGTPRGKLLVEAFAGQGAVQCGFCTPGLLVCADALLRANPSPDETEIRRALVGNLCRCTGYDLVVKAISNAAREGQGLW